MNENPAHGTMRSLQQLAGDAENGASGPLAELHHRLVGPLGGFFRKHLNADIRTAEELAEQTVSETLQALARRSYDPRRAAFISFVYGVARKVRLQFLRQKRRELVGRFSDLPEGDAERLLDGDPAEASDLPLDEIEAMRDCLHAEATAVSLTPEERFVVLGRAQGVIFEQLASQLGCSLDTVHRRATKGLEKLQRCMRAKGYS